MTKYIKVIHYLDLKAVEPGLVYVLCRKPPGPFKASKNWKNVSCKFCLEQLRLKKELELLKKARKKLCVSQNSSTAQNQTNTPSPANTPKSLTQINKEQ